jgi:hypothetical protein
VLYYASGNAGGFGNRHRVSSAAGLVEARWSQSLLDSFAHFPIDDSSTPQRVERLERFFRDISSNTESRVRNGGDRWGQCAREN